MNTHAKNLQIEDVFILPGAFRNFRGMPTKFDSVGGKKSFAIRIEDKELVDSLRDDGWNVKALPARDEGEDPTYWMKVNVNFRGIPPTVYLVTSKGKVPLDEESIGILDTSMIINADVVINPSSWENPNGDSGLSAYLKTMYVTIEEDEFADKYRHLD